MNSSDAYLFIVVCMTILLALFMIVGLKSRVGDMERRLDAAETRFLDGQCRCRGSR